MKRFRWPLERLLDVTASRVSLLEGELVALAGRISAARKQILAVRTEVRSALAAMGSLDVHERIARQALWGECLRRFEQTIRVLTGDVRSLEMRRAETMEAYRSARRSREVLQRLREKALAKHRRELARLEQKELDDSATIRFARGRSSLRLTQAG